MFARIARHERYLWILPLAIGVLLVSTNRWYSAVDDECLIIDGAAKSLSQTMAVFLAGPGQHEHPPLYDIILHGWLRLTGGNEHLLRLPSIVFYVLGTWILARTARNLGGIESQLWVLVLVALWPLGFHYGRLATWYSFCFLLVSLLTLTYLNFQSRSTVANWVWLLATSLALIYSNYFGWVLLACLALDYFLRDVSDWRNRMRRLLPAGIILVVAYLPLLRPFLRESHTGIRTHSIGLVTVVAAAYNFYCTFVSESVAPWFWYLGIPAGIVIAIFLVTLLLRVPGSVQAFFSYFLGIFVLMTSLGILFPKRLLFISPWLILPIGVTLGTAPGRLTRRILVISLAVAAGIGWYGIFSRRLYLAPHWIEPWESVARQSADVVRSHGMIIAGNNSFFYYLTYLFSPESPSASAPHQFAGLLPKSVRIAGVYDPRQWLDANRPLASTILLVKSAHFGSPDYSTDESEHWLEANCKMIQLEQKIHDDGFQWKQRIAPELGEPEWRIETKRYQCR